MESQGLFILGLLSLGSSMVLGILVLGSYKEGNE